MKNILFIHQSAELYGSDKTLLLLLKKLDKSKFFPIVILPFDGPLKVELEKENIQVIISPVLKLYRKMFSPTNLFKFFKDIKSGIKVLDKLNEKYHFDLVYSNTLAVLLGIIYAKKRKIKHLWHVHEIIESPKLFTKLFCKILASQANTKIIYNSIATQKFWDVNSSIANKSLVIWNGLEPYKNNIDEDEKEMIRLKYFNAKPDEIVIALVGRISRWKGQLVLFEAFKTLANTHKNIKLVFIGSTPPNQENFLEDLNNQISKSNISDKVTIIPFQDEIAKFWLSIDIAAVPSTEPEPFGLVAVEAMLAKKPVIASNLGGLTEIVVNDETGILFEPNNVDALTKAISILIENKTKRDLFGQNGFERALTHFSLESHIKEFETIFEKI